ncbi:MAG: ribonuclease E/G [Rhodospirillales bacterium]
MSPIDTVLVSALGPDRRAACLAQGRLVRYLLTPPDSAVGGGPRAGDVFLGRVARVDRGLAAAFVDIGAARPGFLAFADASDPRRPPAEGEAVAVRVLRAAESGKGAKLSGRPPPASERLAPPGAERPPVRLQAAPEPIIAAIAAAANATADAAGDDAIRKAGNGTALTRVIVDDADTLVMLRRTLPAITPLLHHHRGGVSVFAADAVDDQLAAAMAPWQSLAGGGAFAVRETPAAVTIDVDLGAAAGGEAAVRTTNLEAMTAIAEMIVLADLAGHIVIDPVAVRDRRQRAALLDRLRATLAAAEDRLGNDRRVIRFGGFTPLGLIELVRERRAPSLRRQLGQDDSSESASRVPWVAAGDALRALVAETATRPGRVPGLLVNEAVAAALAREMAGARAAAEDRAGGRIAISVADAPVISPWKLVDPR